MNIEHEFVSFRLIARFSIHLQVHQQPRVTATCFIRTHKRKELLGAECSMLPSSFARSVRGK